MDLSLFDQFADPYMQTPAGRSSFLAGILLGYLAQQQAAAGASVDTAPLYKQINFGKMQRRDVQRHIARIPELLRAYDVKYKFYFQQLASKTGELLLQAENTELGIEGNFAFAVGFLNAADYFWQIFGKTREAASTDPKNCAAEN